MTATVRLRNLPVSLVVGSVLVGTLVAVALVSNLWTPHDPAAINTSERLAPPGTAGHLLGTDRLGRDVTSQIMAGARNSMVVSVVSTLIGSAVGVLLGLRAAASSKFLRDSFSRLIDVSIALPAILIALALAAVVGPGQMTVMVAIIVGFIPWAARITIGPARQILAREFVQAAFAYGRSRWFVMFRHILPNVGPIILVQMAIMFAGALLTEASLSFLGLGAPPPTQSWGRMLGEARAFLGVAPTLMVFPGIAITIVVLGFNLLANGLHAVLDPHQRVDGRQSEFQQGMV